MSVTPLDGFVLNGSEYEMRDKLAQSRIDNLVAQNNPTDGNTELLDIRVGADGHTYDSAGQAVREQINKVLNSQSQTLQNLKNGKIIDIINGDLLECAGEKRVGYFRFYQNGTVNSNDNMILYDKNPVTPGSAYNH